MESITLYHAENDEIKIDICAYFEGELLVIDGYDIGKRVEEYWGDSDYEYIVKIPIEGVNFLYNHFTLEMGNRKGLLDSQAATFNTNSAYSNIRSLMEDNGIKCEGFTWA